MNNTKTYTRYALCREMLETPGLIRSLNTSPIEAITLASRQVLLSGEGSSRIFPARRVIAQALRHGWPYRIVTEAALQAAEYDLTGYHLFVASNSGKTAEGVHLIRQVSSTPDCTVTGVVAHDGTPIATGADSRIVLQCGPEEAVAATKSVVEQALVYDMIFRRASGASELDRNALAEAFQTSLTVAIDPGIVKRLAAAPTLYFSGRNDGVAEELTLKTNEITRVRSDYLEGTYAVHGIEEVMQPAEAVVLINPYPEQEEKFDQVLREGVGLTVVAIASRETRFPTIRIPDTGDTGAAEFLQLAAGWNLLVEIGLARGVDPDKPERARKVGNEFVEPVS